MAKPSKTPPASDIDGVDQDRQPIDAPENSDPDMHDRAEKERKREKGRPPEPDGEDEGS